jgi:hypothetical protein
MCGGIYLQQKNKNALHTEFLLNNIHNNLVSYLAENKAIHCENNTKHTNTLRVQTSEFQYLKVGGIYYGIYKAKQTKLTYNCGVRLPLQTQKS